MHVTFEGYLVQRFQRESGPSKDDGLLATNTCEIVAIMRMPLRVTRAFFFVRSNVKVTMNYLMTFLGYSKSRTLRTQFCFLVLKQSVIRFAEFSFRTKIIAGTIELAVGIMSRYNGYIELGLWLERYNAGVWYIRHSASGGNQVKLTSISRIQYCHVTWACRAVNKYFNDEFILLYLYY